METALNPLEQALHRAATDPSARPEFYRVLLASEVYVIGRSQAAGNGPGTLPAGSHLSLAHWAKDDGTLFVPFFSSLERLRDTQQDEARFVALVARDLFEISRGASLVLNPGAAFGKEFFPEEIDALLDTGVNHAGDRHVVAEPRQVLLGQPAQSPSALLAAVSALLPRHANVRAAYLALMDDPARPPPALVIGIEGDGDLEAAIRETGAVAADTAPADTPVDLVAVHRGDGGLGDHFLRSVPPFYTRGFAGKLRSLFGG